MRRIFGGFMIRVAGAGVVLAVGAGPAGAGARSDRTQPAAIHNSSMVRSEGAREPREILIPFEDADGPCRFPDASPLRDRYASRGVSFFGPGDTDGAAILGDCSQFGVEGYGGYRFLAFNAAARLAGGGIPRGPETLEFAWPVQKVKLLAGSPAQGRATLTCFDEAGARVDSATLSLTRVVQPLTVSGAGMIQCELSFDAPALVVDNLRYTPQDPLPIPAQTPVGAVVLVVLLALAGTALLRAP